MNTQSGLLYFEPFAVDIIIVNIDNIAALLSTFALEVPLDVALAGSSGGGGEGLGGRGDGLHQLLQLPLHATPRPAARAAATGAFLVLLQGGDDRRHLGRGEVGRGGAGRRRGAGGRGGRRGGGVLAGHAERRARVGDVTVAAARRARVVRAPAHGDTTAKHNKTRSITGKSQVKFLQIITCLCACM